MLSPPSKAAHQATSVANARKLARTSACSPCPARTARRGAPRKKGDQLPSLAGLAPAAEFTPVTVTRYGKAQAVGAAVVACLWYSVFHTRPATVVLIRDKSTTGFDLALVTSDTAASPAQVIERSAARWSIEVAIADSKQEPDVDARCGHRGRR